MEPNDRHSLDGMLAEAAAALDALRLDEALEGYQAAAALAPENYEAHLGLARTLMRMRNGQDALTAAGRCIALDGGRYEAYVVQGAMHFLADDLDEAEEALDAARERAPDEPEPLLTLAQVYSDRRDFEQADAALAQARGQIEALDAAGDGRSDRDELMALAWHAETYRRLAADDQAGAYEAAQRVIALEEANPYAACLAYSNLGIMETRNKNYALAAEYLERAWNANPHFFRAGSALGRILLVTGKPARAAEILEQVVAHKEADTAETRYAYALALGRSGRRNEAREQYGVALDKRLSGAPLILAHWQRIWLASAARYTLLGAALLAMLLWVLLGEPSTEVITLVVMIVVLLALQRLVGRRR